MRSRLFDVAMTVNVMRYISDLRIGRVNPSHFNFDINVQDKKYDLAEFVSDNAVDATDVPRLIAKVEPDSEQYRKTEAGAGAVSGSGEAAGGERRGAAADGGEGGVGGRELSGGRGCCGSGCSSRAIWPADAAADDGRSTRSCRRA